MAMKPRRSKRLLKTPVLKESESSGSEDNGKKQRLELQNSLLVDKSNKNITYKKKHSRRNGFGSQSKSPNTNGNESDSSDSSVDYMKSPQTLDLNSEFFKVDFRKGESSSDFAAIEKKIFSEVQQLTDTENSSDEERKNVHEYVPIPLPFSQLTETGSSKTDDINKSNLKHSKKRVRPKPDSMGLTEHATKKKHKKRLVNIKSECKSVDKMDVSELLALGETQVTDDIKHPSLPFSSEEELTDWEEVRGEESREIKQEPHSFPKEGVQITVDAPDLYHKRKKKDFDMAAFLKRRLNQVKREQRIIVHKVHVLCWIAHGLHVNTILNSEELMGLSLSLIPSQHSYPNKVDIIYLKKICGWFVKTVPVVEIALEKDLYVPLLESLQKQFENGKAKSRRDLVLMFVCLLRSLGLTTRLIISLQPLPLKPSNFEMPDVKTEKGQQRKKLGKKKVEKKVLSPDEAKQLHKKVLAKEEAIKCVKYSKTVGKKVSGTKKPRVEKPVSGEEHTDHEKSRRRFRPRKNLENKYKDVSSSSDEEIIHEKKAAQSACSSNLESKVAGRSSEIKFASQRLSPDSKLLKKASASKTLSNGNESLARTSKKSNNSRSNLSKNDDSPSKFVLIVNQNSSSKRKKTFSLETKELSKISVKKDSVSSEKYLAETSSSSRNIKPVKKNGSLSAKKEKSKLNTQIKRDSHSTCTSQTSEDDFVPQSQNCTKAVGHKKLTEKEQNVKKSSSINSSENESDFEHELTAKMKQTKRKSTKSEIDRRVLSSDSDDSVDNDKSKNKNDFWVEVLADNEQWIPVDVITGDVDCAGNLYKRATRPVTYIVAWNPDLTLKDVTRKYCTQFHSITRKQRVDENWWREALFPFLSPNTARDAKEDEDMQKQIEEMPQPKSISEYKNHPLYVLQRHLLKFQAIYPPNSPTVGFVRNEPVYRRECVYTLHSRDMWLKEAKVVRLGEKPYKIVKARPKWDRMSGKVITDLPLEIFGPWQVEDYEPPTATDGKVPRNAYGNVELFKPSMLPKGTVHLQVPCLNRVAKKLQIDCAPAVVGFDFHCGASHPMYDGFVVCEEFQDVLLDAWNRDQEESERREQEKRDKRIYGNWRRLIKGLLIRERLNIKYGFGDSKASTSKVKKGKKSKPVTKKSKEEEEDDTE